VFIHLLDANGKILAQIDAQPYGGAYPTSLWDIDEIIRDYRTLTLPSDLASGEYKIELGLYEYSNLARLNVVATTGEALDDHLILTTVKVVR
jgi:hypothetical protein